MYVSCFLFPNFLQSDNENVGNLFRPSTVDLAMFLIGWLHNKKNGIGFQYIDLNDHEVWQFKLFYFQNRFTFP